MDPDSGYNRRTCAGCLLIIFGLIVCGGILVFTLDRVCYSTLSQRLPIYPGAQTVDERHNMFNAFGMGETYAELHSPDALDVVTRWYVDHAGTYEVKAANSNDPAYGLARSTRAITKPEDGSGTDIELYGTCLN